MTHKNCGGVVTDAPGKGHYDDGAGEEWQELIYTCKRCGEVPESEVEDDRK